MALPLAHTAAGSSKQCTRQELLSAGFTSAQASGVLAHRRHNDHSPLSSAAFTVRDDYNLPGFIFYRCAQPRHRERR